MDLDRLHTYCLAKPATTDGYPFGPGALVYKVEGKMFALIADDEDPLEISLKCDPGLAEVLRDVHDAVRPGYHLNKQHWNTVTLDGSIDDEILLDWVDDSYDLVVDKLPKATRDRIRAQLATQEPR
jgi:predicted DNA-binding protein (MmcQ/YjbR family)